MSFYEYQKLERPAEFTEGFRHERIDYLPKSPRASQFFTMIVKGVQKNPHFWIVHLVSLITPERIEPITWNWSHFKDISEVNTVNFRNECWGPLGNPTGAPKDQK